MEPSKKRANHLRLFTSILLCCSVVSIILLTEDQQSMSIFPVAKSLSPLGIAQSILAPTHNITAMNPNSVSVSNNVRDLFKEVEGSVVQVTSKVPITDPNAPRQQPGAGPANQTALGSGFVYDRQGHIVTNSHVVSNARTVDITLIDGNRYSANLTGRDPYSDLAVLKIIVGKNITANSSRNNNATQKISPLLLKPLPLGNSSKLEVGDQVAAIGNPYGLDNTITTGIISQIGRLLPDPTTGYSMPDVIQTDAALNPGNSGGPLLDTNGQVIGVNTGILSSSGGFSGIGFAISSNTVKKIVPILIEKHNYVHPSLGLTGATLTSDLAQRFKNLPSDVKGVVVDSIAKNRSADKAGMRGSTTDQYGQKHGGDIITAVDGKNITRFDDLISYLEQTKSPSNNVKLTLLRDGKYVIVNVILGERPSLLTSSIAYSPSQPSP